MKANFENISITGIIASVGGLLFVIAVIVIATWIHKRKNEKAKSKTASSVLPKDTDWGSELTDEESGRVQAVAQALYADMKGLNFWMWSHDEAPYKEMMGLSDKMFVAVANQFAVINGNGESLTQWLNDEVWVNNSIFRTYAKNIINRLASLGAQ